jgi:hypothetical protein
MASELREVFLMRQSDGEIATITTKDPSGSATRRHTVERLPLLTPEAKAVIEAAVALVTDDPSDPWGYQKDVQFDTLRGEVAHYIATRGTDAN